MQRHTTMFAAFALAVLPALTAAGVAQAERAHAAEQNIIEQRVYVQTTVDTDHDGREDRVAIDIARPATGAPVPVVFEQSPYRYGLNDVAFHDVDVDRLPQGIRQARGDYAASGETRTKEMPGLPGWYDDYFLPRGYAVILGQSIGTADSTGCPTTGDINEALGATAVIDWLNGRAPAYNAAGERVYATWATGKVGMLGVSYNGTLANMAAATGVDGLEAIVPISAISSWYDYYRANGLVVAPGGYQGEDTDVLAKAVLGRAGCGDEIADLTAEQDRTTGDYSAFWRARNYVPKADKIEAAVFVMHGHSDWNVKGMQYAQWWKALSRYDVPRKIWLHNGGHGAPSRSDFKSTIAAWFDYHVKGIDNGIMNRPMAQVQLPNGTWQSFSDWPVPAAEDVTFHLSAQSATAPGRLSRTDTEGDIRQDFVDEGRNTTARTLVAGPDKAKDNRLVYRTEPLSSSVRLSGIAKVTLKAAVDNREAANLTALLVDYGPPGSGSDPVIVTRGWLDPQNRDGVSGSDPIEQGKEYTLTFQMQPKDYVFHAGRRIGLVVISTDYHYTLRPAPGTRLHLVPSQSAMTLPLVSVGDSSCAELESTYSGQLSSGDVAVEPNGDWFHTSASGQHSACLDGPDGADFDLYLQKWNGYYWVDVAHSYSSGPDEQLTYQGTSGYYRYQVYAYSGSGKYTLGYSRP